MYILIIFIFCNQKEKLGIEKYYLYTPIVSRMAKTSQDYPILG